ncbi:MAG TPA: DNA adenine methylase [Candidatus Saccharimonadales bacterium]
MSEVTEATARPFIKWAGGKGKLVPQLKQFYPKGFRNYFEPFFGGGAVFFSIHTEGESYINDINDTLIDAYAHVRGDVEEVIVRLRKLDRQYKGLSDSERQAFYYRQREVFNATQSGIVKSILLIFLNKTCFNGLYRENSKGHFNVPFGRYTNPTICDEDNLRTVSKRLQTTHMSCGSYEDAVSGASKGDFVYLDPPYFPLNSTSSFTAYHEDGFTAENQEELRDLFVGLDKRGCCVMLSNSAAPFIEDLYKNYRQELVYAGRSINASGAKRGKIPELVVLNY